MNYNTEYAINSACKIFVVVALPILVLLVETRKGSNAQSRDEAQRRRGTKPKTRRVLCRETMKENINDR